MSTRDRMAETTAIETASPSASIATESKAQSSSFQSSQEGSSSPLAAPFKNDLRLYRLSKGVKQAELAKLLGIPRSRLSLWEGGRALPSLREAMLLSSYLGVPISVIWPDPRMQEFISQS
jgi:DNA-binding XRE family transcriptional regulator